MSSFAEASWPLPGGPEWAVSNGLQITTTDFYLWAVILGGILSFTMAWGIGANDVANAFATSVGAGSISLGWACVIASCMEFLGALLLGSRVTELVRKSIIDVSYFDPTTPEGALNGPELLMVGNVIILLVSSAWLIIATLLELPVSTTHTTIGAYIGVGMAYRGAQSVQWIGDGQGLDKLKSVAGVFVSWIVSPLLSGLIALTLFLVVRFLVLRRENPVRVGLLFAPFLYFFTIALVMFFVLYRGSPNLQVGENGNLSISGCFLVSVGTGIAVGLLSWFFLVPVQKAHLQRWEARRLAELKNPDLFLEHKDQRHVFGYLRNVGINLDANLEVNEDMERRLGRAEEFDPKAEKIFSWMQVFSAAFDAFSHGANDVANAIAPFSATYELYKNGGVLSVREVAKFHMDGTYTGGGTLSGQSFSKGDPVPNGFSFCGELVRSDAVKVAHYACELRFAFVQANATEGAEFDLYDSSGARTGSATCFRECNPGCVKSYEPASLPTKIWVLALGGLGIVVGLSMWGYRIIIAIGKRLTKITPARGFCIEIGASITVLLSASLGLPVSTTHCQVGSTIGVGIAEGRKNAVNWKQFAIVFLGWVVTLVFSGLISAGLFAFVSLTPYKFPVPQSLKYCPGQQMFVFDTPEDSFRGIVCSGLNG